MIYMDDCNNIAISKGDTLALRFKLSEPLQEGDIATLTIADTNQIVLQADVSGPTETNILDVVVSGEDMDKLELNTKYYYDLKFTFADGRVYTADWTKCLKVVNTAHSEEEQDGHCHHC